MSLRGNGTPRSEVRERTLVKTTEMRVLVENPNSRFRRAHVQHCAEPLLRPGGRIAATTPAIWPKKLGNVKIPAILKEMGWQSLLLPRYNEMGSATKPFFGDFRGEHPSQGKNQVGCKGRKTDGRIDRPALTEVFANHEANFDEKIVSDGLCWVWLPVG